MSVQAGVWNFDGKPADTDLLEKLSDAMARYGPDAEKTILLGPVGMLYRPFHTTLESRLEHQPYVSDRGYVITWDGRLDNRDELIPQIWGELGEQTDVGIAMATFEKWGTDCFRRLIGDWALTIWDPTEKTLTLARDYAAIRHLYYYKTHEKILWCTHLAPIVLLSRAQFTLNHEYVAGYLVAFPEAHLTPYREIHAVSPGKFIRICGARTTIHSYWAFDPKRRIRHKSDAEYEQHFRDVFRQAVRRRLRSDSPILADLSGGFDSSSIVCMADDIIAHEGAQTPSIDTISLYDLKEPDGDDFSYFTKVEEKRGRTGFHIDLGAAGLPLSFEYDEFVPTPGLELSRELRLTRSKIIEEGRYRVSLSGVGGDELNGQAAEFRVQLADLMVQFRLRELAIQLKAWSLLTRRPWIHLLFQALIQLFPSSLRMQVMKGARLHPWINSKFARRYRLSRLQLGEVEGARFWLPNLRDKAVTLASMANQLAAQRPSVEEKRCPYLDRDLVEFLTSIPEDQLLRPGERRSLMRRALVGLLPSELVSRRTKAGAGRCYMLMMERHWHVLESILESPLTARLGYINPIGFHEELRALKYGRMSPYVVPLMRALALELWLRDATRRGVLSAVPLEPLPLEMNLAHSSA